MSAAAVQSSPAACLAGSAAGKYKLLPREVDLSIIENMRKKLDENNAERHKEIEKKAESACWAVMEVLQIALHVIESAEASREAIAA